MSWNELELDILTLEAETVNKVYENIDFLRTEAISKGLTVDTLETVNAQMNTIIAEIRGVLQKVENDFTVINTDVAESLYFDEHKNIGSWFRLPDYQRWVLMLRDLYDIIVNEKGQWGQMFLTLEDGQPDVQINGNDVYIRGDSIA